MEVTGTFDFLHGLLEVINPESGGSLEAHDAHSSLLIRTAVEGVFLNLVRHWGD